MEDEGGLVVEDESGQRTRRVGTMAMRGMQMRMATAMARSTKGEARSGVQAKNNLVGACPTPRVRGRQPVVGGRAAPPAAGGTAGGPRSLLACVSCVLWRRAALACLRVLRSSLERRQPEAWRRAAAGALT